MNYYKTNLAADILANLVLVLPLGGYLTAWLYCRAVWGNFGSMIGIPLGLIIAATIGSALISGANRIEFGYWAFWR